MLEGLKGKGTFNGKPIESVSRDVIETNPI